MNPKMKPVCGLPAANWDSFYMGFALYLAHEAALIGEVPVGAVAVCRGRIVGIGRNCRETAKTALGHAELEAISKACKTMGGWRLLGCDLYVTLEPCPMCAGAIVNARIRRVIFGAEDPKAGACGSVFSLFEYPLNHRPLLTPGVLGEECAQELRHFFSRLRASRKQ